MKPNIDLKRMIKMMKGTLLLLSALACTTLLLAEDEPISLGDSLKRDAERYEEAQLKLEEERFDKLIEETESEGEEESTALESDEGESETESEEGEGATEESNETGEENQTEPTPEEEALKEMQQEVEDAEEQYLKEVGAGEVELEFKEDDPEGELTEQKEAQTQESNEGDEEE
jgi:hypothetical protein